VKLVDAGFIWTEPHSKRLKVKLTIQAEVFNGTILQQGFVVEFIVENHMCLECNRANANPNSWTACAQVGPWAVVPRHGLSPPLYHKGQG
jgi:nonsense-mediated mRNA decay protein 3